VAYVRYASVYKDFQDAKDFQEFLDGQMSFDDDQDELDFADKDAK
jgi:transcriptional regulator NrdR family protein